MNKNHKRGKGGQLNPKKKWHHLKLKQRERILQLAADTYINRRGQLKRRLDYDEKIKLIKGMDLGLWIPEKEVQSRFMSVFDREESKFQKKERDKDE